MDPMLTLIQYYVSLQNMMGRKVRVDLADQHQQNGKQC